MSVTNRHDVTALKHFASLHLQNSQRYTNASVILLLLLFGHIACMQYIDAVIATNVTHRVVRLSVCLCVGHMGDLCRNCLTD